MRTRYLLPLIVALLLSACDEPAKPAQASEPAPAAPAPAPTPVAAETPKPAKPKPKPVVKQVCEDCGVIATIREVVIEGEGTGMGAVSGAAAGGAVGNQFGKGDGKTVMTVVGVLAGAAAGHMAEKKIREETVQRFTVRMDDGSTRTVDLPERRGLAVGMKVRVAAGALYLRD